MAGVSMGGLWNRLEPGARRGAAARIVTRAGEEQIMCDQDHFEDDRREYDALGLVTRRQFGVLVAAGLSLTLPAVLNAVAVTESGGNAPTPDGTCDEYFVRPAAGAAAGVLIWPDIFGLRPAFRQMGKRLAESGY